jgi:aldehyde dehydrogenase (NAD+)
VAAASGQTIAVVDPSDGQPPAQIACGNAADIDAAVRVARAALGEFGAGDWGRL